jgi:hypothetical protein
MDNPNPSSDFLRIWIVCRVNPQDIAKSVSLAERVPLAAEPSITHKINAQRSNLQLALSATVFGIGS